MKIDLTKKIVDLNGTEQETQGDYLAIMITNHKEGNPIKLYELVMQAKSGIMEIDRVDFDIVKTIVEQNKNYNNIVRGPILISMMDAKDKGNNG